MKKIISKNQFTACIFLLIAMLLIPGCGAGGSSQQESNTGAFSVSVSWPDRSENNKRTIPYGSSSISISITGDAIPSTSPIVTSISSGTTVVTIGNIPVGPKVALIKALDATNNIKAQRKESFTITADQTVTADHVPLGIALIGNSSSPEFEPSSISVLPGQTVYFQNWLDSSATVVIDTENTSIGGVSTSANGLQTFSQASKSFNMVKWPHIAGHSSKVLTVGIRWQGTGVFGQKADHPVGNPPYDIASADFRGIGRNDIVTANSTGNNVSVFLNNADGTFSKNDYPVGGTAWGVAVGDVSGDGKPDIVVANIGLQKASVLINKGDGTFNDKADYPVDAGPQRIAVGDFNGDQKLDIASANGNCDVSVLLNNGSGSFGNKNDLITYGNCWGISTGDLNNDGKTDILATCTTLNSNNYYGTPDFADYISIFMGNGDGTFSAKRDYQTPGRCSENGGIGDYNRDGIMDVVVCNTWAGTISFFPGNNDGTLGTRHDFDAGAYPMLPFGNECFDLNDDGNLDLFTADWSGDRITVLMGAGNGTFGTYLPYGYIENSRPISITAADFNNDGKLDIATANNGENKISVYPGL